MPSTAAGLTPRGKQLEAGAIIRRMRETLVCLHADLDINSPESSEVARLVTESRRSLEALGCPLLDR